MKEPSEKISRVGLQVLWFKRDLRLFDHEALNRSCAHGRVLLLYIFEPELWKQPDLSHRHFEFLKASLRDLHKDALSRGARLTVRVGSAKDVLMRIHREQGIAALWSHQETWNGWTYARDKSIQKWIRSEGIPWHEPRQFGVVRCLKDRDGWSGQWNRLMGKEVLHPPRRIDAVELASDTLPESAELGLAPEAGECIQPGGRTAGLQCLHTFLGDRGEPYTRAMSSPVTAFDACSRLSPYSAFGCLSLREIHQNALERMAVIKSLPRGQKGQWPAAMRSFSGRLRWHCHFMQKLEDEPRIEFENFHSAYDGLRPHEPDRLKLDAWKNGQTGYPMVDACMRALRTTGWINFRMRAMLMSFASYHLWLDWREPALHLARLFTDYEPGIHYSQCQMQSGTTGINVVRAYNPLKQSLDHDPEGVFLRRWLPELEGMPNSFIHQPWLLPEKLNGYPRPIVDEKLARKQATERIYAVRRDGAYRTESALIVKRHGSRKRSERGPSDRRRKSDTQQAQLNFENQNA